MTPEEMQKKLWEFWAWVIFVGGHWVVLSAVLNIALRLKKAEQWVEAAEQVPLLATGIRWLRGLGVDPAAALRGGATVASAKAAATTAGRAVSGFFPPSEGEGGGPPTPRDPSALPPPPGGQP